MIQRVLSLLFLIQAVVGHAQALLVLPYVEDPDALHFNEHFISRNGVACISGERMVKHDGQPMRTEPARYLYRFDMHGHLIYANNSFGTPGTGKDTTSVTYDLDSAGNVTGRLKNDLAGYFSYKTIYDPQGRPVRETYSRVENLGTDRYTLVPGATTEISSEHFGYTTVNDTCWRKTYFNYLDLPYREETFTRNRLGYLLVIEDRYLISERRSRTVFAYDESGRLAARTDQRDLGRPDIVTRTWQYDAAGNVISGELWHGDRQQHREEFMYDEQTMLLKARLRKDMYTGTIHVIKYITERR